jgi:hypothetical protein
MEERDQERSRHALDAAEQEQMDEIAAQRAAR